MVFKRLNNDESLTESICVPSFGEIVEKGLPFMNFRESFKEIITNLMFFINF
jgi:hypothetical protein